MKMSYTKSISISAIALALILSACADDNGRSIKVKPFDKASFDKSRGKASQSTVNLFAQESDLETKKKERLFFAIEQMLSGQKVESCKITETNSMDVSFEDEASIYALFSDSLSEGLDTEVKKVMGGQIPENLKLTSAVQKNQFLKVLCVEEEKSLEVDFLWIGHEYEISQISEDKKTEQKYKAIKYKLGFKSIDGIDVDAKTEEELKNLKIDNLQILSIYKN